MAPGPHSEPTPGDRGTAHRQPEARALERLIDARLTRRLRDTAAPAITIVGYERGRAEVLARDERPEQRLIGFVLPARFEAIAVFSPSVVSRDASRKHTEAMLAVGALRSGATVTRIAIAGRQIIGAESPQGWVVDAALRALGLPTVPAEVGALDLLLTLWLDRLMVAILSDRQEGPLTWAEAVELCPLAALDSSTTPSELGLALAASAPSWSDLREATALGGLRGFPLPADWAAWMDDGMFGRWCLGYFPDLSNLRADVEFLAPERLADNVARAVATARRELT